MLYWLIYILIETFIQGKLIKKGDKPIYLAVFLIRGIFSIIHGAILDIQYNTWQYPILLGFQTCSLWIVFDLFLNLLRMEKWNYKGQQSGWFDKLEYKYYYPLKIVAFLGIFVFYKLGLQYWSY